MLNRGAHNYEVTGYIVDGRITYERPKFAVYRGFELRDGHCYEVYSTQVILFILIAVVLLLVCLCPLYRSEYRVVEFRVSFCDTPYMRDDTLYCYVVNVADIPVTVSFTDGKEMSTSSYLLPADTLSVTSIQFIPTAIVYNNKYQFPLEVQYD